MSDWADRKASEIIAHVRNCPTDTDGLLLMVVAGYLRIARQEGLIEGNDNAIRLGQRITDTLTGGSHERADRA